MTVFIIPPYLDYFNEPPRGYQINFMSDIKQLTQRIRVFRDARNWKKFHNPKDLAISLALEAAEVLEHVQWLNEAELKEYISTDRVAIGEELVDVLYYVLTMADTLEIDLVDAFEAKMKKNEEKYPVNDFRGRHSHKNLASRGTRSKYFKK